MKKSSFLSLNIQDFLKSLIVSVLGGVAAVIAPSIQDGSFVFNWTVIWHTAIASGLAYLCKNLFSPTPKTVQIDPSKTSVVDEVSKQVIMDAGRSKI